MSARTNDIAITQAKGNGNFSKSAKVEVIKQSDSRKMASGSISSCKPNCKMRMNREHILNFFPIFPSPARICMVIKYRLNKGIKS